GDRLYRNGAAGAGAAAQLRHALHAFPCAADDSSTCLIAIQSRLARTCPDAIHL
ncbi:MAG: hypothetical protein AVDCRST_MAG87-1990, partial [uncultured Thermomicrobiales bacterium]